MRKILVVEDDSNILLGLRSALSSEGYSVETAANAKDALDLIMAFHPDLIILDIMLPGMSGFELCKKLRDGSCLTPIVMLTAKGEEDDKVLGLELGADEYITKPFSLREFLARVKVILRRTHARAERPDSYTFGDVVVNVKRQEVTKNGEVLEMTSREFKILSYFIAHAGELLTRERLLEEVWGYTVSPTTRTVDNYLARLRKKIEDQPENPKYLVTMHGAGYIFKG